MRNIFRSALLAGALAAASPLFAQAGPGTAQQQFDAGTAALDAGEWDKALGIFTALEARLKPNSTLGVVRLRKGEALVALDRMQEAEKSIRLGLELVDAGNKTHHEDLARGHVALGNIGEDALDYAGALSHYRQAEQLSSLNDWKLRTIAAQVRTQTFFDAPAALANVERALALATANKADNRMLGNLEVLKGRALMNAGRFKEAEKTLLSAVRKHGGLTMKVDAADLASRSNLAIAAILSGNEDSGRRYMAYTGAGRLPESFLTGAEMVPPSCADSGLSPSDVAVVQFSVGADGAVGSAFPVYASRQGEVALEFARAVSRWSWTPEQVAKVPPLFRAMTRIEMRCSTADQRPSITGLLEADLDKWIGERGLEPITETRGDAAAFAPLQAELARREAQHGATGTAILPALVAVGKNALTPADQRASLFGRALAIAQRERAPATALAFLAIRSRDADVQANASDTPEELGDPVIAADPRAKAALLLLRSDALTYDKKKARARTLLDQVKGMQALDRLDPLRVGALIRIAALDAEDGRIEAARAAYEETGLSEQQCALVDAKPMATRTSASSNDFPDEAAAWGFEGWAIPEFDVTASGDTVNMRTTIAYPPFIFGKAAEGIIDRSRYSQTYRPEGSLGCGGLSRSVIFRAPY